MNKNFYWWNLKLERVILKKYWFVDNIKKIQKKINSRCNHFISIVLSHFLIYFCFFHFVEIATIMTMLMFAILFDAFSYEKICHHFAMTTSFRFNAINDFFFQIVFFARCILWLWQKSRNIFKFQSFDYASQLTIFRTIWSFFFVFISNLLLLGFATFFWWFFIQMKFLINFFDFFFFFF